FCLVAFPSTPLSGGPQPPIAFWSTLPRKWSSSGIMGKKPAMKMSLMEVNSLVHQWSTRSLEVMQVLAWALVEQFLQVLVGEVGLWSV
ncbi:unnamed protein product, partial [Polarella glacialis]